MDKKGATDYVVYDVPNGRIAFRLGNHNANGDNFEQDEADTNISVFVAFKEFNIPASKIPFTEFKIERETFDTKRQEVIHAIIDAVSSALEGGEFSIPEELAERKDYPLTESYNPSVSDKHIDESHKPLTSVEIIRKMLAFNFD